ncbi:MAG: methyl-accepting chemotaxis protein [Desulfobacterota bacterium]|nr:methyl-accepting chemotaxis protein [Thermodesulfobacteriota bacterium]
MKAQKSLKTKVLAIAAIILMVYIVSLVLIAFRIQRTTIAERRAAMRNLVAVAEAILSGYENARIRGEISLEDAQRQAVAVLRNLRYGADDYFWIIDTSSRMIMHPYKSELEGQDMSSYSDTYGTTMYREMAELCRTQGQGYVQYWWPKPGGSMPKKKMSYVKLYAPWNWVIGTGIYFEDLLQEITGIRFTLIGFIIGLSIGLSILFYWFIRSVSQPINEATKGLTHIGDQVAQAADQVAASSQVLAQASSEQAASLEETSSSLEQMSSMTNHNADNALQADVLMKEATGVVSEAQASMNDLASAMEAIARSNKDISRIIKTIDEIAFQTNLLALNAAVEAARAGEAGAGFAVVADEVRSLAIRAAEAAKSTAGLIETTITKVHDGTNMMQRANEAFQHVSRKAVQAAQLIAEIAAASREQAEGIGQINHVVAQMDKVIQQNAANAEESASAAEELKAQSEYLKRYIGTLQSIVHGTAPIRSASLQPSRRKLVQPSGKHEATLSDAVASEVEDFKMF